MIVAPASARSDSSVRRNAVVAPFDDSERGQSARLLEGELLDHYGAIVIVVPVASFLKSLWF